MIPSRFLICVDSSGTAFDTMNIKHTQAFIPAALEIWPMTGRVAERFTAIEKAVNLFSSMRGINRYPGLVEVFDLLAAGFPGHPEIPDMTDLREFLVTETTYSYDTLKKWVKAHPSKDLEKVLAWSERADALFAEATKGLKPYPLVRESLEIAGRSAMIAIVDGCTPEEPGGRHHGCPAVQGPAEMPRKGQRADDWRYRERRCGGSQGRRPVLSDSARG